MSAAALKREIEMLLGLHGEQAAHLWQAVRTPSAPGPVAIPYPNLSAAPPVTVQGVGKHFDGNYVVTSVQHTVPNGSYGDDLVRCVVAAASGDQAAMQVRPIWAKLKIKLESLPPPDRNALGHELVHTIQQGSGRH